MATAYFFGSKYCSWTYYKLKGNAYTEVYWIRYSAQSSIEEYVLSYMMFENVNVNR